MTIEVVPLLARCQLPCTSAGNFGLNREYLGEVLAPVAGSLPFISPKEVVVSNQQPTCFTVDYYVTTKGGSRGRAKMTTGIGQINNAQSETAVLAYLRKRHPEAVEITIMKLEWK